MEKKLAYFLNGNEPLSRQIEPQIAPEKDRETYTRYRYLNRYIVQHCRDIQAVVRGITRRISDRTRLVLSILDLAVAQLVVHVALLVYLVFIIILGLILTILLFPIEFKRFTWTQIIDALDSKCLQHDWLLQQYNYYYFPNLNLQWDKPWTIVINLIEHGIFLVFEGFPKRLRDRRQYWKKKRHTLKVETSIQTADQSQETQELTIDTHSFPLNAALLNGGDFWQVLYELDESEVNSLLSQKLNPKQWERWKNLKSDEDISNVLWSTLEEIKRTETKNFQVLEGELQDAEKTLERRIKSNEVNIRQQLSQRKVRALWTPFFNGIARLKFSKEEIESFSASGKSFQKFRETITSWQGLLALFCMGLLIAVTVNAEGLPAILQFWQRMFNQAPFQSIANQLPDWLQNFPRGISNLWGWAKTNLPSWVQIGSATLLGLIPTLKALSTYIDSVQKEQARIQGERDILLKKSQEESNLEAKAVAQLRLKVEAERQRLGPNAQYPSLLDFVNARVSEDDYGKHLGLMQQVKQDLMALSSRLTLNKGNEKEIEKLFPRGPARVFLYIDDLDRCPPDRVVEVLEAVQLLLNTELFVVVLAIDDRYVARALEQVYEGVLKRRGKPSGIDYLEKIIQIPYRMRPISPDTVANYFQSQLKIKTPEAKTDDTESSPEIKGVSPSPSEAEPLSGLKSATENPDLHQSQDDSPVNQNTDNLPSASSALEPIHQTNDVQRSDDPDPGEDIAAKSPELSENVEVYQTEQSAEIDLLSDPTNSYLQEPIEQVSFKQEPMEQSLPAQEIPTTPTIINKDTIATVEVFDQSELDLLVDCCQYVDITPRTGKRLINIYKILQIIWKKRHQEKSHDLPDDPTKRVVMSFLALSGRYPDFMRSLFDEIDMRLEQATFARDNGEILNNPSLELSLSDLLNTLQPQFNPSQQRDFHTHREWKRFTSDIRQMFRHSDFQAKDCPSEDGGSEGRVILDRRTFSLMLSFCFVGDLGYDPDDASFPTPQAELHPPKA